MVHKSKMQVKGEGNNSRMLNREKNKVESV